MPEQRLREGECWSAWSGDGKRGQERKNIEHGWVRLQQLFPKGEGEARSNYYCREKEMMKTTTKHAQKVIPF